VRACVLAAVVAGVTGAGAAPVSLLSKGPASNRVNIAILAEGYTAAQSNLFLATATNTLRALLSEPPLSDYSNHFNAVAVFVASAQSGSDHPVASQHVNTYFNSTYDAFNDRFITIPPDWANTNYADGQGKVDALLAAQAPDTDLTVMLVNDPVIGGSDNGGGLAIAATNSPDIVIHETGHVLANLGDEDDLPFPGYPDIEEPNTTRETNLADIKWNAWIATDTPVPTPETAEFENVIGLFEGAHYHETGWYRPKLNCVMRTGTPPFCEVCAEALVLAVYQIVRPVDFRTPAATNVSVTTTAPVSFSVGLVQPTTHTLSVQWFTNNVPVNGATATNLTVQPSTWGNGVHAVRADIFDPTPRVRTDPGQLRYQSVSWSVTVSLPWLRIEAPTWATNSFRFRIVGAAPNGFVVETSTNLLSWTPVITNQLVAGEAWFTNTTPSGRTGLYRVKAQ
jgi:hypothetical protein